MDGSSKFFPITPRKRTGDQHIDPASHTNEKACKKPHQHRGGTHGSQRDFTGKAADHGHIRHIEKNL